MMKYTPVTRRTRQPITSANTPAPAMASGRLTQKFAA